MSTMSRVIAVPFVAMTLTLHGCSTSECKKPATVQEGYLIEEDGQTLTVGEDFSVDGTCDFMKGYAGKFNASTCAEADGEYKLSGCDKTECARPDDFDTKVYTISTNPVYTPENFEVKYKCAEGYKKQSTDAEEDAKACGDEASKAGEKFSWADNGVCTKILDCGTVAAAACTKCGPQSEEYRPCKGTPTSGGTEYTGVCTTENTCGSP